MISLLIGAAMLAGPVQIIPESDPLARSASDACVRAIVRDLGEAKPVQLSPAKTRVRRKVDRLRIDYDVTLMDRTGRSTTWVGLCEGAAPAAQVAAIAER